MLRIKLLLLPTVLFSVFLSACGSSASAVTSDISGTATSAPSTAAQAAPPATSTPATPPATAATSGATSAATAGTLPPVSGGASGTTNGAPPPTPAPNPPNTAGASLSISGTVDGATQVSVAIAGVSKGSTSADANGSYAFSQLQSGNYNVVPSRTGFWFIPVSRAAVLESSSLKGLNFTGSATDAATYSISGTVRGSVAAGVAITLNGSNIGGAVTDLDGNFTFSGLVSGTYTLSASLKGYSFSNPLIVSLANKDSFSNDFTAATLGTDPLQLALVDPLPAATVGNAYSISVLRSTGGGKAPYLYQTDVLAQGAPPIGMILNPNGKLTGTPASPGKYSFGVCASDASDDVTETCATTTISVVAATVAAPEPRPTLSLSANPATITAGAQSTLSWTSKDADSCTGSGGWTNNHADSGSAAVSPATTTTYMISCSNASGTSSASTTIVVQAAPAKAPPPTASLTSSAPSIDAGASATLTWSSENATSCAASGGWSGIKDTSGSGTVKPSSTATYTIQCTSSSGTAQSSTTITVKQPAPAPTPNPPAPTPPVSAGTSWVYYNGQFDWPGDYSFVATPNYSDTSGAPLSGSRDIKVTLQSAYGGWLPYAQNWNFNSAPYTKLTFALKPTAANQSWRVYFVKVGDIPVGIYLDVSRYGPAPIAGKWATYTVPLSDLGVLGQSIYKFCIQDTTGLNDNSWFVDNVGFVP